MRILRCYLETSLFGFYFDDEEVNREKREAVRTLFRQVKEGLLKGYISDICLTELMESPEPYRTRFGKLLKEMAIEIEEYDREAVFDLAKQYVQEGIIPSEYETDALHIAIATVEELDILITLNCKHIANEFKIRKVRSINYKEGYGKELAIRTPMEVIYYED